MTVKMPCICIFSAAALSVPATLGVPANTVSRSCQCTTSVIFAIVLSVLLALLLVAFTIVIITGMVFVRNKKQAQTETDVYYDTINIGHHSEPPPVIETEVNVVYDHTKST